MSERLKMMGRLEELRLQAEELRMQGDDLRKSIREMLPPGLKLEELDSKRLPFNAAHLASLSLQLQAVLREMADIKEESGLR